MHSLIPERTPVFVNKILHNNSLPFAGITQKSENSIVL